MSPTWYDAATDATKVRRWISGQWWKGLVMGSFEVAHSDYKALAKEMRENGLRARVVSIGEGTIGMSGTGANLVKRSVIIVPEADLKFGNAQHQLYDKARELEEIYW